MKQKNTKDGLLLAIDVGNSNITFGLFRGNVIEHQWRLQSNPSKTSDEYGIELAGILGYLYDENPKIDGAIIACVVPELVHQMTTICVRYLGIDPMIVGEGTKTGLILRVDNPREVGADRIINAVAGLELFGDGSPLILIDVGTAITHDVVSANGEYLGGSIAPGMGIAARALTVGTSKLPRVELEIPDTSIGNNTEKAMQVGIVRGYLGLIDGITESIIEEIQKNTQKKPRVIATGGFSNLLNQNLKHLDVVERDLTLFGLRIVYDRTVKAKR